MNDQSQADPDASIRSLHSAVIRRQETNVAAWWALPPIATGMAWSAGMMLWSLMAEILLSGSGLSSEVLPGNAVIFHYVPLSGFYGALTGLTLPIWMFLGGRTYLFAAILANMISIRCTFDTWQMYNGAAGYEVEVGGLYPLAALNLLGILANIAIPFVIRQGRSR